MHAPGAGMARGPVGDGPEGFENDTQEVAGLQVEGNEVRMLNPVLIQKWVKEGVKLSELSSKLKGKIPQGFRLPTEAEVAKLHTEKDEKFPKLTQAAGISEGKFSFLTDDGSGPTRTSEWSVNGSSYEELHEDSNSEEKREPKLRLNDVIFLVRAESLQSSNK